MTDPAEIRQRARDLRAAGRAAEADGLLQAAIADHPGDVALRVEHSIVCRVLNDHARSLTISDAILAEHPQNHAARVERIEALVQTRDYAAARTAIDALAALGGETAFVAQRRAQTLRGLGDTARAAAGLGVAILRHPADINLKNELAALCRSLGQTADCVALCEAVLADAPANRTAHFVRIEVLTAARSFAAAQAAIAAARAQFPDDPLLPLRETQLLRSEGRTAEAAAVAEAALERHPSHLQLRLDLATSCKALGQLDRTAALADSALQDDPANRQAHFLRIDALAAANRHNAARDAIAAARLRLPADPHVDLREAQLLRAMGRLAEAATLGEAALAQLPHDIHLRLDLAGTYRGLGNHDRAIALADSVLQDDPANRWALLSRIDAMTTALRHDAAREAIAAARQRLGADPHLDLRAAQILRAAGQLAEAAALGEAALAQQPGDTHLRLDLAGTYRMLGNHDRAIDLAAGALQGDPANRWALFSQIEGLMAAGRLDGARAAIAAAAQHLSGDPMLALREAQLLRTEGRFAEAVAVAEAALTDHPRDINLRNDLAAGLRALGQSARAAEVTRSVLADDPGNRGAQFGRIEDLLQTADQPAILAEIARLQPIARSDDAAATALATDLLVRLLPTLPAEVAAGPLADLGPVLTAAAPRLTAGQAWALYRKADEVGLGRAYGALCDALFDGRQIGPHEAGEILRTLQQADDPAWAEIGTDLATRMRPDHAGPFRLELVAQAEDAAAALSRRKALLGEKRDLAAVRALAQVLVQDGRADVAARYLGRVWQRLPDGIGLIPHLVSALMQTGRDDAARALVAAHSDRILSGGPGRQAMLAGCLIQIGDVEEACRVIAAIASPAHSRPHRSNHVRALISLGRIDEAAAVFADLKESPQRREDLHTAPSLTGVLIAESMLAPPETGGGDLPVPQAIARIQTYLADGRAPTATGVIPRQIAQFWDRPVPPPGIARLMASWQDRPGFGYRRFDARSAAAFIAERLGADWTAAWRMARTATEQSDFFRLCLLMCDGGIYADADDRLYGDLEGFCDRTAGLTLYAETFGGALGNNLILTPPRHPAIIWAAVAARRALVERHNDGTWFRLGPGLLTRAVARHIGWAADRGIDPDLTLMTQASAARLVMFHVPLPYKRGSAHWNQTNASGALAELVARHAARRAA